MRQLSFFLLPCVAILFAQCQLGKQPLQSQQDGEVTQQDSLEDDLPYYFKMDTIPSLDIPEGYKIEMSDYVFMYDAVSDRNTLLTSYLKSKKSKKEAIVDFPIKDTIVFPIDLSDTVQTSVFKVFAEYNAVSGWALPQSDIPPCNPSPSEKELAVTRQLDCNVLIFSGQIDLSDKFDSYLFVLCDTTQNRYNSHGKDVYIVNMKDDAITSISEFFYFVEKEDIRLTESFVSINENKVFHRAVKNTPGECEEWVEDSTRVKYIFKFDYMYDDMGQIVILRCPMDYYDEMNRRVEVRKKLKNDSTVVPHNK